MCTKVSTFYKGIDVSTGEVVSKFFEGIARALSHSVRSDYGIALNQTATKRQGRFQRPHT